MMATKDDLIDNLMNNCKKPGDLVGENSLLSQWDIDRHFSFVGVYGHFFAGRFLKETGSGEEVDYVTTWLTYKF
jgi:hypothetical protein